MELTVVVNVLGLDCTQHSSRIAPLNGDRDPLEEELEETRLPCFCLEAMSQFVEELQASGPQTPEVSMATGTKW